jgi:ribonuclease HII
VFRASAVCTLPLALPPKRFTRAGDRELRASLCLCGEAVTVLLYNRNTPDVPRTPAKSAKSKKAATGEKQVSKATLKLRLLKRLKCTLKYEKLAWAAGAQLVAGVDEVGRGSLFGPVVAAAVILDPTYRIRGLRDSKLLDRAQREALAPKIREHSLAWAIAAVDVSTIDQINIYWASKKAMEGAVGKLALRPDHLLIDALRINFDCGQTPIIHGDALSASIAAASIIAKVERDAMVSAWDPIYPEYGLASNKGYSTPRHLKTLRQKGPTPLHRLSFAPVWTSSAPQEVLEFMLEEKEEAGAEGVANQPPLET